MEGIRFITNNYGQKTEVIIDLSKYGDIWEDLKEDIESRREEARRGEVLTHEKIWSE